MEILAILASVTENETATLCPNLDSDTYNFAINPILGHLEWGVNNISKWLKNITVSKEIL